MPTALLVSITLWLAQDPRGMDCAEQFSIAWPRAVPVNAEQWVLRGEGGPCGVLVAHPAREGSSAHGVCSGEARAGALIAEPAQGGCAPLAAARAGPDCSVLNGGAVAWRQLELHPWPPPESGARWETTHECAVRRTQSCMWLTLEGAVKIEMVVQSVPESLGLTEAWQPALEVSVHCEALRSVTLPEGLGWSVTGGEWPFGSAAVLAQRKGAEWQSDGAMKTQSAWPLSLGADACVGPCSAHGYWFAAAERADTEGPSFRLLLLPRGSALQAGEGRVLRMRLGNAKLAQPRRMLLLWDQPRVPQSEIERLTAARLHELIEDPRRGIRTEDMDAGDWMHAEGIAGNLEYDTVLGCWHHAQRCGDVVAANTARAMLDHLLSVDRQPGRGFFHEHGRGHRTGHFEAGHHWVRGMLALTDAERDPLWARLSRSVIQDQAEALRALDPLRELPRSLGWGLQAAVDAAAHHTIDTRHAAVVRRWTRSALQRLSPSGTLVLEDRESGALKPTIDVFVQAGALLPALSDASRLPGSSLDPARVLSMASLLWKHVPVHDKVDGDGVADTLSIEERTGRILSAAGRLPPAKALLALAGLAHADPALRAQEQFRRTESALVTALGAERPRWPGMSTSLLLRAQWLRGRARS